VLNNLISISYHLSEIFELFHFHPQIYLSGNTNGAYEQVKKLLNVCGATRLDRLNENVSHVVVLGTNLLEHEHQILQTLHPKYFLPNCQY
jgi:hypothetical protein